jgi:transcriptional regulator with XRE-family HTH domain
MSNYGKPESDLAQLRIKKGLTQLQLAVLVGVTPGTIQGWERNGLPQISKYRRLAEVLGCKLEQLAAAADQGLFDPDELASKFGVDDEDESPHQMVPALPAPQRRRGRPPKTTIQQDIFDPDELESKFSLDGNDNDSSGKKDSLPNPGKKNTSPPVVTQQRGRTRRV